MNIPYKITKLNFIENEKIQENQTIMSKYHKEYSKLIKQNKYKENDLNLKEEIINWFFSLDHDTRIQISSIENKFVTHLIHQLYLNQKYQPNLRFIIKEGELIPKKEDQREIYKMNLSENGFIFEDLENPKIKNGKHNSLNYFNNFDPIFETLHYDNYFDIDFLSSQNYYGYIINSFDDSFNLSNLTQSKNLKTQEDFIKEIKFYKSEDLITNLENSGSQNIKKYSNYFCLSEKLIKDEKVFRYYFDKISQEKSFINLIGSNYDQNLKFYNVYLPDWINNKIEKNYDILGYKKLYSTSEIIVAFFEQIITIKYFLHKNLNSFKFSNYYNQLINEKKEVHNFLMKSKKSNTEILSFINEKNIVRNLYENSFKGLGEFIKMKLYQGNAHIYFTFTKFDEEEIIFDKENSNFEVIKRRLEKFILNFDNSDFDKFIDNLLFLKLDKIFTFDDFLFRQIYECLIEMRQRENFEDLINGNLDQIEEYENESGNNNNKNKKKKKRISTKRNNIEEIENNYQLIEEDIVDVEKKYNFNFIKRKNENNINNINKNENFNNNKIKSDYIEKVFMGNIMLTKKSQELNNLENITYFNIDENKFENKVENNLNKNEYEKVVKMIHEEIMINNSELNDTIKTAEINKDNKINQNNEIIENNEQKDSKIITKLSINNKSDNIKENSTSPSPTNPNNIENNDTDTAYSSEGKNMNNKKKIKEKKFFLYEVNKKTKKKDEKTVNTNLNKNNHKNNNNINKNKINLDLSNKCSSLINSNDNFNENQITINSNKIFKNEEFVFNPEKQKEKEKIKVNDKECINDFSYKRKNSYSNYYNNYNYINDYNNYNSNKFSKNNIYNTINEFLPYKQKLNLSHNFYNQNYSNEFYNYQNPHHLEFFENKLHKDILDFSNKTENILIHLRKIKKSVLKFLENEIKKYFDKNLNIISFIKTYGSFSSEMDIESSDIDVTIQLENYINEDNIILMKNLSEMFLQLNQIENVNTIYTATVPVIKLLINPEKICDDEILENLKKLKLSEEYKNYNFDKCELELIKIDLTFYDDIIKKNRNEDVGSKHVEFIKDLVTIHPEIKIIMKIMKRFLQIRNFNNSFTVAFVKFHNLNNSTNLGKFLIQFLFYYGCYFDFNFTLIDITMENPYVICQDILDQVPYIIDPITYNNVGRSSYKISEIKNSFELAYQNLFDIKNMLENNRIDVTQNIVNLLIKKQN